LPYVPPPPRETPKLADKLEEPVTSHARPEFIASNFVMMDIDSDTEEVVGLQPEQAQGHGHYYIPKTMQEMAEEHATRRQQLGSDADDDIDDVNDGEEATMASPQALVAKTTRKNEKQATVKIILPSKALIPASTSNNLSSSRSTKAKTNTKSSTTPNLKRKQRRPRKKVEEESDSADLTDEEDQEDDDKPSSPSKRARVRAAAKDKRTPVAITPSTRTLRPRIAKTTAQIGEERQDEDD